MPLFFVVSGAKINLYAVLADPLLLIGFIASLLLIRAVPIFVSLSTDRETRSMSSHNRVTVALYCTTALPLIVAVTSVATKAGAMSQDVASVLVASGAITVLVMPLLTSLTYRVADAHPVEAAREVANDPHHIGEILQDHWVYAHLTETSNEKVSKRREKKRAHAKAVLEVHHKRHDLIEQAKLEQHQRHLGIRCET